MRKYFSEHVINCISLALLIIIMYTCNVRSEFRLTRISSLFYLLIPFLRLCFLEVSDSFGMIIYFCQSHALLHYAIYAIIDPYQK